MLKRVKYVSRQARPLWASEVDMLIARAAETNAEAGITGALVIAGNVFFQIIEGPPDAIDALFDRIRNDTRHTAVSVLTSEEGREIRLFPQWAMRRFIAETSWGAMQLETAVHQLVQSSGSSRDALVDDIARMMRAGLRAA